jgi:hypothetical protein
MVDLAADCDEIQVDILEGPQHGFGGRWRGLDCQRNNPKNFYGISRVFVIQCESNHNRKKKHPSSEK